MPGTQEGWTALESGTDGMNKFLRTLGIPEPWEFVEVFSLDKDMLGFIPQPVAALVFCFPTIPQNEQNIKDLYAKLSNDAEFKPNNELFFMHQPGSIGNACGTYSVLHALANSHLVDRGSGLFYQFFEKAKHLDSVEKSGVLQSFPGMAEAHESAAAEGRTNTNDVSHHFVSYVLVKNEIYEFDSCQYFARPRGVSNQESFLFDGTKLCEQVIKGRENLRFSVVALVGSKFH